MTENGDPGIIAEDGNEEDIASENNGSAPPGNDSFEDQAQIDCFAPEDEPENEKSLKTRSQLNRKAKFKKPTN